MSAPLLALSATEASSHARLAAELGPPLRVIERAIYRGPHLYSSTPMIRIQVDLGGLEERPTNRLPGFTERLTALLPSLHQHGCSYDQPGGLIRRMQEGTWLGHVVEHVALELQSLAGSRVTRGKTRSVRGQPGVYNVMYAYWEEPVGLLAGRLAFELVRSLLPPDLQTFENLHRIYDDEDEPALQGAFDLCGALDGHGGALSAAMPWGRQPARWSARRSGAASRRCGSTTPASSSSAMAGTSTG